MYPGADNGDVKEARAWLADGFDRVEKRSNGSAFSNFIDPTLENWEKAYYGKNFDKLVAVKSKYDPDNVFYFKQGIPPR